MARQNWAQLNPRITPQEFEDRERGLVSREGTGLKQFQVHGSRILSAEEGTYEIDVSAEFTALGEAAFAVLIECKRYKNAVKRDVVMVLNQKLQELGAQKGMVFSTSGFQKGAIVFAKRHGIALVKIADGRATWMTRGLDETPPPAGHPQIEMLLRPDIHAFTVLGSENPGAFLEWLHATSPAPEGPEPPDDPVGDYDAAD